MVELSTVQTGESPPGEDRAATLDENGGNGPYENIGSSDGMGANSPVFDRLRRGINMKRSFLLRTI